MPPAGRVVDGDETRNRGAYMSKSIYIERASRVSYRIHLEVDQADHDSVLRLDHTITPAPKPAVTVAEPLDD